MKKITQEELKKTVEKHKLWLRGSPKGKKADLSYTDLRNTYLYEANLYKANLSYTDLEKANLYRANLENANLTNANLYRANLYKANLENANLENANLTQANLTKADLSFSNLTNADLESVNLTKTNLENANLENANLTKAILYKVNLDNANLHDADLTGTSLANCNLSGVITDKKYLQIVGIGSSREITTFCVEDKHIWRGWWNDYKGGSLEEFTERVEEIYGEKGKNPDKKYYDEYFAIIEYFKKRR